ncbi:MAG: Nucleoside triphosphate pyrophosphohydrolase/pyrophosphatase MazG [Chroococcopsis gigantea SAG 12.99]|jgi:XTP/dITP diphosphohydrolase|nr:nucleoside triphosphate pyrophosphohydrolase [Chlorogloea purpurea SAG 13.99]MDV3001244.1 Nucleoside triphosphate pyrophosphohydrolase/pyrophosphatase MazG [Chroococcopsis gigantea SAG 12.99]
MSETLDIYQPVLTALNRLLTVVAQLRHPVDGCPWDLAQTPQTLIPYIIEEAHEVVWALKNDEKEAVAEELGDLLLQVVLQSQIASENQDFSLKEVAEGITEKLIRRHPHVFGELKLQDPEQVRQNWEKIKAEEKGKITNSLGDRLIRYTRTLPPLMASMKISEKAAQAGLEWENIEGVWSKFNEELAEFKEALSQEDKNHQKAELGDLLFTLINIARWYGLNPSESLEETNSRFISRFSLVESFADKPLADHSLDELEILWKKAKATLNQ